MQGLLDLQQAVSLQNACMLFVDSRVGLATTKSTSGTFDTEHTMEAA